MSTNLALTFCVAIGWLGMFALAVTRLQSPIARWELPLLSVLLFMQLGGLIAMMVLAVLNRVFAGGPVNFWGLYVTLAWIVAVLALLPLLWKLGRNREALRAEGRLWAPSKREAAR